MINNKFLILGIGTYTTKDGQVYTGRWYNDKLMDEKPLQISYCDGSCYEGTLLESKYSGAGQYVIDDNLQLSCEFSDNKPTGDVIMLDHKGTVWSGMTSSLLWYLNLK